MYTVQELIEALQKCPKDYLIELHTNGLPSSELEAIAIDHDHETVDLFAE
jgi:hypothetical protein